MGGYLVTLSYSDGQQSRTIFLPLSIVDKWVYERTGAGLDHPGSHGAAEVVCATLFERWENDLSEAEAVITGIRYGLYVGSEDPRG